MILFLSLLAGLVGLCIGSFLNVVLFRYNTGKGLGGRSACLVCDKALGWVELVPLGSFLAQKGKCRGCEAKISRQYPLVELLTGVGFSLLTYSILVERYLLSFSGMFWSFLTLLVSLVALSFLILIAVYDLKHKIIPDEWVIGVGASGLLLPFVAGEGFGFLVFSLLNRLLAGVVLGGFLWIIWHFSKGRAMGFGDVKLAAAFGFLLGLIPGIVAMVLSFWIGAIVGVGLIAVGKYLPRVRGKAINLKTEIPFAPFLVFGIFIAMLLGERIVDGLSFF